MTHLKDIQSFPSKTFLSSVLGVCYMMMMILELNELTVNNEVETELHLSLTIKKK